MKTPHTISKDEYISVHDFVNDCIREHCFPKCEYDYNKMDYYISGTSIYVTLNNQKRIPYEIRRCDYFKISSDTLNSWDNFPKKRYYTDGPDISLILNNTQHLDMSQLRIQYPQLQALVFNYFDNLDLKNIHNIKINELLYFRSVKTKNIYDLSQYRDIMSDDLEFCENIYCFKNLPDVLLCKYIKRLYINNCEIYDGDRIDTMSKIIFEFISKNNREEYIMDMTLALVDNGFENEV